MPLSFAGLRFASTSTLRPCICSTGTNLTSPDTICRARHSHQEILSKAAQSQTLLLTHPCNTRLQAARASHVHV